MRIHRENEDSLFENVYINKNSSHHCLIVDTMMLSYTRNSLYTIKLSLVPGTVTFTIRLKFIIHTYKHKIINPFL